ncbi:MAG: glycosyltransferase family 39 protein [Candidatus Pacebacteria bacterium]|nr:glycosyltransferase family 39 protein [Candidatus Paceibacterota bacterium]
MLNSFVKYEKYWISGIIIAAFIASLCYSFGFSLQPSVDARAYDSISWDIAQGKGYDTDSSVGRPGPGYEYFLAAIFYIFGHSYPAVWIIQALLLAATAYLVFLITRLVFKESWHPLMGLIAAALVGLSPDLISMSAMLMTEMLVVFLSVASIYCFFKYIDAKNIIWIPLAAISMAAAILTRSNLLFLVLPMIIYFIISKDWKRGLLFIFIFLICFIPWTVRNYGVYGEFKPFNSSMGLIYVGNHSGATGELVLNYSFPEGYGDFRKMDQIDFDNNLGRAGIDYIIHNPLQFIKLTIWRISTYFSFARPFAFWPHLAGLAKAITIVLSSIYSIIIFGLGLAGAVLSLKRFGEKKSPALLLAMFLTTLSVVVLIVETRYRLVSYPMLAVFGGFSVYWLASKQEELKRILIKIWPVLALLAANTAFDVIRNWDRIIERL